MNVFGLTEGFFSPSLRFHKQIQMLGFPFSSDLIWSVPLGNLEEEGMHRADIYINCQHRRWFDICVSSDLFAGLSFH